MLNWLKNIFVKKEEPITDNIVIGPIDNPILKPNDVNYKFPSPTDFRPPKVKFKIRYQRKKKKK